MVFTASGVKAVYGAGAALALGLFLVLADEGEPAWMWSIPLFFLIVFLGAWPADIVLDEEGVLQRSWWGRETRIRWCDVASALYRSGDGSTFIFGYDGSEIRHTGYHAAPARYQAEVKKRGALERIADWDAVPSLIASQP